MDKSTKYFRNKYINSQNNVMNKWMNGPIENNYTIINESINKQLKIM